MTPKYKTVPIKELKKHPRNVRIHPRAQVEELARAIEFSGVVVPLTLDEDGVILAGHGRLEALEHLGKTKAPVVIYGDLTEEQKRVFMLADNRIGEKAEIDDHLLTIELGELSSIEGLDVTLTGYTLDEIADRLDIQRPDDPDNLAGDIPADNYREQHGVIVMCEDEPAQQETYEALREMGYVCRVVTT